MLENNSFPAPVLEKIKEKNAAYFAQMTADNKIVYYLLVKFNDGKFAVVGEFINENGEWVEMEPAGGL